MAACLPAEAGGNPSKPASPPGGRPAAAALERHLSAGPRKHEHGGWLGMLAEHGAQVRLPVCRELVTFALPAVTAANSNLDVTSWWQVPCSLLGTQLLLIQGVRQGACKSRSVYGCHRWRSLSEVEAVRLQVMVLAAGVSSAGGIEALAEQVEQQVGPPHNYSTAAPREQQAPPADASSSPTQSRPASALEAEAVQEHQSSAALTEQLQPPASVLPSPQVELLAAAPKRALLQQLMPALTAALAEVQTYPREVSIGRVAEHLLQVRATITSIYICALHGWTSCNPLCSLTHSVLSVLQAAAELEASYTSPYRNELYAQQEAKWAAKAQREASREAIAAIRRMHL